MKILGVLINCNLDWHLHLKKASKSCHYSLSLLYPLRNVLSYDSRKLLATALTLSHLNYNSCVWYNCSSQNRKTIDTLIRNVARYVSCKGKHDSVSSEINTVLKWLNCKYRLQFEILKLAFPVS
jgi:hypothetical protein